MRDAHEVVELLRGRGHRVTAPRRAIVEAVMRTTGHITPKSVVEQVQRRMPSVNESTVYRTLTVLEELGVLSHTHLHGGAEYHHADASDHVHLTCSECGRDLYVDARETAPMRRALEKVSGFEADFTHFAIAGRCSSCVKKTGA